MPALEGWLVMTGEKSTARVMNKSVRRFRREDVSTTKVPPDLDQSVDTSGVMVTRHPCGVDGPDARAYEKIDGGVGLGERFHHPHLDSSEARPTRQHYTVAVLRGRLGIFHLRSRVF